MLIQSPETIATIPAGNNAGVGEGMGARKQLVRTLVQQINTGEVIHLKSQATYGRLGRLVYAAEQFGFVYDDTRIGFGLVEVFMHRLPSDGPRGMADASALPGLYGRRFRPLPQARKRVAELTARVRLDGWANRDVRRQWKQTLGLAVVPVTAFVLALTRANTTQAGTEGAPAVYLGLGIGLGAGLAIRLYECRARAAASVLLRSYGYVPVRRGNGVIRMVPPGWAPPPLPGS